MKPHLNQKSLGVRESYVHCGSMDGKRGVRPAVEPLRSWLRTEPRAVPRIRELRTTLRTGHLIAFGSFYGGHVYGVPADQLLTALAATVATGGALMALEIYRAPVWVIQLRGLATLLKIALMVAVAAFWELRVPVLTLVVVIGAVTSHMPSRWRYHSPFHGRVVGPQEKG